MGTSLEDRTWRAIASGVEHVLGRPVERATLRSATLPELGVDSISVLELVGFVERELALGELNVQGWLDEEASRVERRFSVQSLADKLCQLGDGQPEEPVASL